MLSAQGEGGKGHYYQIIMACPPPLQLAGDVAIGLAAMPHSLPHYLFRKVASIEREGGGETAVSTRQLPKRIP